MDVHETTVTTVMVLVFAAAAGLCFLLADQVIRQVGFLCWASSVE